MLEFVKGLQVKVWVGSDWVEGVIVSDTGAPLLEVDIGVKTLSGPANRFRLADFPSSSIPHVVGTRHPAILR